MTKSIIHQDLYKEHFLYISYFEAFYSKEQTIFFWSQDLEMLIFSSKSQTYCVQQAKQLIINF